jgi:hypothetical protein
MIDSPVINQLSAELRMAIPRNTLTTSRKLTDTSSSDFAFPDFRFFAFSHPSSSTSVGLESELEGAALRRTVASLIMYLHGVSG